MSTILRNLWNDETGAVATEYGLIAVLVSVAAIFAFTGLGATLQTMFGGVGSDLDTASTAASAAAGG